MSYNTVWDDTAITKCKVCCCYLLVLYHYIIKAVV